MSNRYPKSRIVPYSICPVCGGCIRSEKGYETYPDEYDDGVHVFELDLIEILEETTYHCTNCKHDWKVESILQHLSPLKNDGKKMSET